MSRVAISVFILSFKKKDRCLPIHTELNEFLRARDVYQTEPFSTREDGKSSSDWGGCTFIMYIIIEIFILKSKIRSIWFKMNMKDNLLSDKCLDLD